MKTSRLIDIALTLPRLGVANLARAATYRAAVRLGLYRRTMPIGRAYAGPFWTTPPRSRDGLPDDLRRSVLERATRIRGGELPYFSCDWRAVGFPPSWLRDYGRTGPLEHWTRVREFAAGDIKQVWEPSRFDVLPVLAAAALADGEMRPREAVLADLELWLADWVHANPANAGPNWRCAQETALRLISTLVADRLLREHGARHGEALERFVAEHCRRIRPTMLYAVAQDNNHATSEAVALYVGGGWLRQFGTPSLHAFGIASRRAGRRAFERAVRRLVLPDGTFSQYSVNYHRLFLDTACVFELFRRQFGDAPLDASVLGRLDAAARWLAAFTEPVTGDAPNLGANDGARLLQLGRGGFRDFRPHAQLAAALFGGRRAFDAKPSDVVDDLLQWFGVSAPAEPLPASGSALFSFGGYALLVNGDLRVFVRLPAFRFRPSHSDILHIDVWWRGENVVRDGGSYSYNASDEWLGYFPGAASHSTVQFDGRDQMPKLSRFLFGRWPSAERLVFDADEQTVSCGYRDYRGAVHQRTVVVSANELRVEDRIDGSAGSAVSRIRLRPGPWRLEGDGLATDGSLRIAVAGGTRPVVLREGFESRYYGRMESVPVLERGAGSLPATIAWHMKFA